MNGRAELDLIPEAALVRVRALHGSIDTSAARLEKLHAERLRCRRGCSDCCVDELEVSLPEAARIAHDNAGLLASAVAAPPGRCAMLDIDGACRIYSSRPYVCRTQGLPLRWTDENERTERRDECPKNTPAPGSALTALEDLPAEACWTLGAAETALATLAALTGAGDTRISLRSLFISARQQK